MDNNEKTFDLVKNSMFICGINYDAIDSVMYTAYSTFTIETIDTYNLMIYDRIFRVMICNA
jgi:hypothetical protein